MVERMFENTLSQITIAYNNLVNFFPPYIGAFLNFLILVLFVVFLVFFLWKFYKFISKKNIIELNLNKYNKYEHPFLAKFIAGFFYIIEYIIILPFLIFFWFSIFTLFLMVLSQNQEISQILIISAVIIAAIRMTSYYKEELSQEVAKVLPITFIAVSALNPNFFTETTFIERILTHLSQLPDFISQITYYLGFIIFLEVILRFFDLMFFLFGWQEKEVN